MFRTVNPETIAPPLARYSHAVAVEGARRLVFCSGQLGMDQSGAIPADVAEQTRICFANIEKILRSEDMTFANIVRINAFAIERSDLSAYMAVRDALFPASSPPASTLILVAGFSRPEFKIEIEVVAAD